MTIASIFILFLALIVAGIPIGMILATLGILPNLIDPWFSADPQYIIRAMIGGVNSFPVLAVPMFILSGNLMAKGKISEKLFNFFSYFIANKTAGLPIATIVTCLFYGAISGSGPATTAAVGAMAIPVLTNLGYDIVFSTALVAVAGGLGVIIPPSIPFIFYGQSAGVSVADIFVAGVVPGLLIGLCLMIYSWYYCKKNGEDKEKLQAYEKEVKKDGFKKLFLNSFWALLSPIIILGSIYTGVASPTEAAVISVFYSLIVSVLIYKTIKLKDFIEILKESVGTYSTILFIIAAATGFARVLTFMKAPEIIAGFITNAVSSKIAVLLVINLVLLFVGMIMDTTPAILVLTPILLPIAVSYGINPIHFGVMLVVNLAIGFVTPPLGINLFVASSLTGVKVESIVKKAIPFIIAFLIALLLITFIPKISLILLGG
ncbi:TRAP transporter large permease [Peptoniphilus sp. AGMB00490]|uniref:TRAP transporter large permease n=2 Tax=Peptoniphilus TaxID=162289 RepID=A0ACD6AZK5_9FIRM|nr:MULTISPECIES: TRAP transporter large permease [Peptoniphilus]NMW84385.1 TRAP transporter large permease [Peptoniphilus faecalis]OLR65112.1 C4-dicarboxylate ABC transporter permease [Peptoniphilus porci]